MDSLFDGFMEWLGEGGQEELDTLEEHWTRIAEVLPELGDIGREVDWVDSELQKIGLNIRALMLFSLKLALAKNVAPMDFSAQFTSGYIAGYIGALEHEGQNALDQLEANRPPNEGGAREEDDDEYEAIKLEVNVLQGSRVSYKGGVKMTLDTVGEQLREKAREIGKSFDDPDDDWAPVMLVITDKEMGFLGLDFPNNEQAKTVLFEHALPMAIKKGLDGKAQQVGLITSAWTLAGDSEVNKQWLESREPGELIEDHPDRTESLFLYLADREGTHELWTAAILRDGEQAPALQAWKKMPVSEKITNTGRIPKMMRKILA